MDSDRRHGRRIRRFGSGVAGIAIAAFLLGAGTASAVPPNLEEPVNVDVGRDPDALAVADLNGDGRLDLVDGLSAGAVTVALGTGKARFEPFQRFDVSGPVQSVGVADYTGDGRPDVVAAASEISLLPGDGRGSLGVARSFAVDVPPAFVAPGDFNRDGNADVATGSFSSTQLTIYLGDGRGRLVRAGSYETGGIPGSLLVQDFNADRKADLATEDAVLLGDGAGHFSAAPALDNGGQASAAAAGDLNRDGRLDLAVSRETNNLAVLLGDGAGGFLSPISFLAGSGPGALVAGGFRPGILDLAVINNASGNVSLFNSDGAGGFLGREQLRAGRVPKALAVGDADRDGREDLFVANIGSDDVSVLLNAGQSPVVKDFRVGRRRFRAASGGAMFGPRASARRGSSFRYTLSKPVGVKIALQRAAKGRFSRGRCRRATRALRRKRRCSRLVRAGSLRRKGVAGENRNPFSGRIHGRKLRRGRYRATIVGKDRSGRRAVPKIARFRIVRR